MEIPIFEVFIRLFLAFLLSVLFGLERQLARKPVGFGTFTLVATGSCLLTLIALGLAGESSPLPMLGGVITGVGFLGAGAIIRYHKRAFGFTTAASIWAFAALGVGLGAGFVFEAVIFYVFIIVVIALDRFLEGRGLGNYSRTVDVSFNNMDRLRAVKEKMLKKYCESSILFDAENQEYSFSFTFTGQKNRLDELVEKLIVVEGVKSVRVK